MADLDEEGNGKTYSEQLETKRKEWVKESEQVRQEEIQKQRFSSIAEPSTTDHGGMLKINTFIQSRIDEMVSVAECLSVAVGGRRVFQMLPPHMRRRAMSHNPKRVPRRIREAHQREVEKHEKATPSKRPSRKHRRRPKNLLEEYNRRKQSNVWLETHIWHAKRFKMEHLWGYNVPIHPRDKSVRATYRAVAERALLQDISFYNCIELNGTQEEIIAGFGHLTNSETSLSPAAKLFLDGNRQGIGMMYHRNTYPFSAIGPYHFMWKPCYDVKNAATSAIKRTIWIWVHPAAHDEVVSEFESVFSLRTLLSGKRPHPDVAETVSKRATKKMRVSVEDALRTSEKTLADQTNRSKDDAAVTETSDCASVTVLAANEVNIERTKNSHVMSFNDRTPVYASSTMTMVLLKDTLVRFRLRGSKCIATLAGALKIAQLKADATINGEQQIPEIVNQSAASEERTTDKQRLLSQIILIDLECQPTTDWWKSYYTTESHTSIAHTQIAIWEKLQREVDAAQLPPNCILGLTVRDPRLLLPRKRVEASASSVRDPARTVLTSFPKEVSSSPLWDAAIRDEVTYKRIDLATLNRMRSQNLMPGTQLELGNKESRIPVMLVQHPGARSSASGATPGLGAGFDLILPSGWGMAFWIALVYNGARASGVRNAENIELQQGYPVFPNYYPDTNAGKLFEKTEEEKLTAKYERLPPAKRVNFSVLGIVSPFAYPWLQLVQDWAIVEAPDKLPADKFYVLRCRRTLTELKSLCVARPPKKENDIVFSHNCLVGVNLEMIAKGTAQAHSIICLPTSEDIEGVLRTVVNPRDKWDLKESRKGNPLAQERKEQRSSARILRNRRRRVRKKIREKTIAGEPNTNVQHLEEQLTHSYPKAVPLLPDVKNIVKSCDRDIIGFVTVGEFGYSKGSVMSSGYCAMLPLNRLLQLSKSGKRPLVLVRETCSDHYRAAWLQIVIP